MPHPIASHSLSIVIPVYNSGDGLRQLIDELAKTLPTLAAQYEVILIDDASRDHSWQVITDLTRQSDWVHGIELTRNYGQHNALLCGIRAARYPITITMDDDLQHPPDQIHLLLDKLSEGYDVVYGAPEQERHGILRDLASQVTKLMLQSSMGVDTARSVSAFRAFRTQIRDAFASYQNPYVSLDVLLTWGTTRFAALTVRHDERQYGVSNYTLRKLVRHALNMITGFSTMPLRAASIVGFIMTLFGIVILVYVLGTALLQGTVVPGFAFLASVIAIFSGTQMFLFGIMGEYLARMYFRTLERPVYTIRVETPLSDASKIQTSDVHVEK